LLGEEWILYFERGQLNQGGAMLRGVARYLRSNLLALAALFVALGGGALAATKFAAPTGQIHACVDRAGHLTLLRPGKACGRRLSEINWSQQGPRGVAGLPGLQGAQGAQGPQGVPGVKGEQGVQGVEGPRGPGATAFEQGLREGAQEVIATINDVHIQADCEAPPHKGMVGLAINAQHSGFWWGQGAALKDYSQGYEYDGGEIHLDVIAREFPSQKWTHFQLAGVHRPAGYCLFSGLVTQQS
jgi:hypothetical protein